VPISLKIHAVISHTQGEYLRDDAHTNTIKGFWSPFQRQVYGIHHWVGEEHLPNIFGEATWRDNRCEANENARVNSMLAATDGKVRGTTT
jgi:ISXO2-like transposase domain